MRKNTFVNIVCNVLIFTLLCSIILFSFWNEDVSVSSFSEQPISSGKGERSEVSLMINVYWGTEYIMDMLDIFDEYSFQTTFFVGGVWALKEQEMLKEISKRGHEIGNHAYSHKDLAKLPYEKIITEISNTNKLIELATGKKVVHFTPPSGSFSKDTLKAASDLSMKTFLWSKDTIDWRDKDESVILKRATSKVKPGDIILMHPTKCTRDALKKIFDHYNEKGIEVVTISELIK